MSNQSNPLSRNDIMKYHLQKKLNNSKMMNQMSGIPRSQRPANLGDINSVYWPFWFTFNPVVLAPNQGISSFFSVTLEAGFNMIGLEKVVFKRTGQAPNYIYTAIDGNHPDDDLANAKGLVMSLKDSSSSRLFNDKPMPVDMIGTGEHQTVLSTPQFILPNSTIECVYVNNNTTETFVPLITAFGFRIRVDGASNILSTISG